MEFHKDGECLVRHSGFCLFLLWIFKLKHFSNEDQIGLQKLFFN